MYPPSKFSLFQKLIVLSLIGATFITTALIPFATFAQANNQQAPFGENSGPNNAPSDGPSGSLFPENATGPQTVTPNTNFGLEDKQAQTVQSGGNIQQTNTVQKQTTELAKEGISCSAATLLGQVLSSAISSAISELVGNVVQDQVAGAVTTALKDPVPIEEVGRQLDYTKLNTHAQTGVPGPFGIYVNVGWDSIAWCVINAMIEYIANATIAWANSGFNGNPAFLENPERFFRDLADYQAGTIIRDIAYGASGGAVNVCQPFRVSIAVGLAQSYPGYGQNAINSNYRGMSCRLSDITQQKLFQGVSVGTTGSRVGNSALTWTEWSQLTQQDQNNPYGAYILANRALYSAVEMKNNELRFEIGANNGWLNFKKCPEGETDQSKCNTTTPGRLIEAQLNSTLDQSKQRLVMATKFDQMITAIVNNLIKVALNKVLEEKKN